MSLARREFLKKLGYGVSLAPFLEWARPRQVEAATFAYAHGSVQWLSSDVVSTIYTVSGLSFQPKALRFCAMGTQNLFDSVSGSVTSPYRQVGFAVSTSDRRCVLAREVDGGASSACSVGYRTDCIAMKCDAAGVVSALLDLNSITSDGFTLIINQASGQSLVVYWEAWGGSDITVAATVEIVEPAATGNVDYTVSGFVAGATDQVVMFAGCQATGAAPTMGRSDAGLCIGFATSGADADNVAIMGNAADALATMNTKGYCKTGECVGMHVLGNGTSTVDARAKLTQFGTNNFRLNWLARATSNRKYIALALKGGAWKAGAYVIDGATLNATATITGLPFAPIGLSLIGALRTESTAGVSTADDRTTVGCGTTTADRSTASWMSRDASAATELYVLSDFVRVLAFPSVSATVLSAYDINAMNSDGFQIIVDVAGGVASEWQGYLAFGASVSVKIQIFSPGGGLILDGGILKVQ